MEENRQFPVSFSSGLVFFIHFYKHITSVLSLINIRFVFLSEVSASGHFKFHSTYKIKYLLLLKMPAKSYIMRH